MLNLYTDLYLYVKSVNKLKKLIYLISSLSLFQILFSLLFGNIQKKIIVKSYEKE